MFSKHLRDAVGAENSPQAAHADTPADAVPSARPKPHICPECRHLLSQPLTAIWVALELAQLHEPRADEYVLCKIQEAREEMERLVSRLRDLCG